MKTEHGCWFCHKPVLENAEYFFSFEWDCEAHMTCIVRAKRMGNPEALVMYREMGLLVSIEDEGPKGTEQRGID